MSKQKNLPHATARTGRQPSFAQRITESGRNRLIPPPINTQASGSSSVGGIMRPQTERRELTPQQQRIQNIYRALRQNDTTLLTNIFSEMGFDITLLATPVAQTPRGAQRSYTEYQSSTSSQRSQHFFAEQRAEDTATPEALLVLRLIREFFEKISSERYADRARVLAQESTQASLRVLFSPFKVSGGRAKFYQLVQSGLLRFLILDMPSTELEHFVAETLITPKAVYTDPASFFKVIEHLEARLTQKPEEANATQNRICLLFDTAIEYHSKLHHPNVLANLQNAYRDFRGEHGLSRSALTEVTGPIETAAPSLSR